MTSLNSFEQYLTDKGLLEIKPTPTCEYVHPILDEVGDMILEELEKINPDNPFTAIKEHVGDMQWQLIECMTETIMETHEMLLSEAESKLQDFLTYPQPALPEGEADEAWLRAHLPDSEEDEGDFTPMLLTYQQLNNMIHLAVSLSYLFMAPTLKAL